MEITQECYERGLRCLDEICTANPKVVVEFSKVEIEGIVGILEGLSSLVVPPLVGREKS